MEHLDNTLSKDMLNGVEGGIKSHFYYSRDYRAAYQPKEINMLFREGNPEEDYRAELVMDFTKNFNLDFNETKLSENKDLTQVSGNLVNHLSDRRIK